MGQNACRGVPVLRLFIVLMLSDIAVVVAVVVVVAFLSVFLSKNNATNKGRSKIHKNTSGSLMFSKSSERMVRLDNDKTSRTYLPTNNPSPNKYFLIFSQTSTQIVHLMSDI